jgi:hypothetical protein
MSLKFEYLGEFKFIFKDNLGQESEDHAYAFDEIKTKLKNLMQVCTLNNLFPSDNLLKD